MKKFLVCMAMLLLISCETVRPPVVKEFTPPVFRPTLPRALVLRDVKWQVLEINRLEQLIAISKKQNSTIVLIAISPNDYENLAMNMQEFKRYILQQREIIRYYENFSKNKENL